MKLEMATARQQRTARADRAMRVTVQTVLTSTVLALVKIVSGWIGHSYALIADGIESILDIFAALVVLGGLRLSVVQHRAAGERDPCHPQGGPRTQSGHPGH